LVNNYFTKIQNCMKLYMIISGLLLITASAIAQPGGFLQDPVTSKNFNVEKYSAMRGTPFLFEKWTKGSVVTPLGIYKELEIKFNVQDNMVVFNKNDETFEFVDDVVSFTLMPKPSDPSSFMVYKKGISGGDIKADQFVQVLVESPSASLYKLNQKQISEMSEINAGVVKTFTNNSKYYIGKNKRLQFVKLNKADVLNALSDKQDKVQAYIDEKKIAFKKESELVEVLNYYNTL
jgi:hypothetical protein